MSGTGHWHTAGATLWQHGQPGNDPGLGSPTSVTCAPSGSATCYVVLQANGVRPDGAPVERGVVPGFSPLLSSLYRSGNGGSTWTAVRLPAGAWLSTPLACQGPSTCEAGAVIDAGTSPGRSGTAVVLTTTDGGRTWARRPLPAGVALVTRLACPSAARCVALGAIGR